MSKKDSIEPIVVDGFVFYTPESADLARKELEGIRYLKEKADMTKPDTVLQIYNRAVSQALFVTPVGICFLRELREYLETIPYVKGTDILPIPYIESEKELPKRQAKQLVKEKSRERLKNQGMTRARENAKLRLSLYFNVILAVIIIAMFVITAISKDNVTILNYESKLINRYEAWESELEDKESELEEREEALTKAESQNTQ